MRGSVLRRNLEVARMSACELEVSITRGMRACVEVTRHEGVCGCHTARRRVWVSYGMRVYVKVARHRGVRVVRHRGVREGCAA